MSIKVKARIFYPEVRNAIDESGDVWLGGATVGECLDDLVTRYPATKKLLFDGHGRLHRRVYVFVNAESLRKAEPGKSVHEGDQLIIAVLASGG